MAYTGEIYIATSDDISDSMRKRSKEVGTNGIYDKDKEFVSLFDQLLKVIVGHY